MIRTLLDHLAWWLFDREITAFANLTNDDDEGAAT